MAFKAPLVEKNAYYQSRRQLLIYGVLIALPVAIIANFYTFSWPYWILFIAIYIALWLLSLKHMNNTTAGLKNRRIQIEENKIEITNAKGDLDEIITLDRSDEIYVKEKYIIPQESINDVVKEIKGNPTVNYITLNKGGKKRTFQFEFESFYMIKQLEKIIVQWKTNGYTLHYE